MIAKVKKEVNTLFAWYCTVLCGVDASFALTVFASVFVAVCVSLGAACVVVVVVVGSFVVILMFLLCCFCVSCFVFFARGYY